MNLVTFDQVIVKQVFYPIVALMFLKFFVLLRLAFLRIHSIFTKKIKIGYYRAMEGDDKLSPSLIYTSRNFVNLFEMPILFYLVSIFTLLFNQVDQVSINLSWLFVIFRYIHSSIHITYNNVNHRFAAFFSSNIVIMILLFRLISKIYG